MKAISLWQPWATLIAIGAKQFETRSWYTGYRGPLAIHAAKRKIVPTEINDAIIAALHLEEFITLNELPLGCVVCTVDLIDCIPTEHAVAWGLIRDAERAFGDYTPGRFAWKLENVQPVANSPARGRQGFWEWQPEKEPTP